MHPYMIELLARQRESELRRSARRHGLDVHHHRSRSVRHRAGRALAAIGLRSPLDQAMPDTQPGTTGAVPGWWAQRWVAGRADEAR